SVLAFSGGAVAEWFSGNPISYTAFKGPLAGLAISAAIGVTAGLSNADDTGRRYLVGVAAAVQLAIIAAWVGAALVRRHDTADGIPLIRCFGFWAHRPLARSAAFRNCYASVTIFGLPSKSFPACTAETAQLAQPE
ncbi:MAG TPA: hypothetical protein VG297_03950, partial [Bryobacteraceae bacterium]|nr:hypothetical protein [Bryobacteraceae bacterium]